MGSSDDANVLRKDVTTIVHSSNTTSNLFTAFSSEMERIWWNMLGGDGYSSTKHIRRRKGRDNMRQQKPMEQQELVQSKTKLLSIQDWVKKGRGRILLPPYILYAFPPPTNTTDATSSSPSLELPVEPNPPLSLLPTPS
jgi:hypothetical protein